MVLTAVLTLTATGLAEDIVQHAASRRSFFGHPSEDSDAGQHLDSVGQRRVAQALLTFLARSP